MGSPAHHWGSAMGWPSLCVCRARPWPTHMAELPCWGARGSAIRRRFALLSMFPWFSVLFSKHRSRMNVIPYTTLFRSRYGHNGPCFVGFRGRLTLQTPRNVEGYRRNGLSGTQNGVPCPSLGLGHGMAEPLRLQGSAMADPHGRAPLLGGSGVGHSSSVRSFEYVSLVFCAFLEAPKSYERHSLHDALPISIRTQRSLFRRIQRSFDPPNTSKR